MSIQDFVKENMAHKVSSDLLLTIHYKIRDLIEEEKFSDVNELMKAFIDADADVNRLKTILVITKFWKGHPEIKDSREKIIKLIESKEGHKIY